MNIAIIVSGGIGQRFGESVPKQYQEIAGKQIVSFVIDMLKKTKSIDKIVVAAHKDYKDLFQNKYQVEWTEAGSERNSSLRNGLEYIKKNYSCKKVIVLDAVMPLIKAETVDTYMELLDKHQAIATAQKITISLGCYDIHVVDRTRYYLMSSPEAFDFDLIYTYQDPNSSIVEVTQQFPEDTDVYLNFNAINNFKLVYKHDLSMMEILLKYEGLIS
jgi:2-C-methyl-D-erythritol 4-phosphate cytidylyltransferase